MDGSPAESQTALSDGAKNVSAKDDLNNRRKKRASAVRHIRLLRKKLSCNAKCSEIQ